jgi:hypothetical protein
MPEQDVQYRLEAVAQSLNVGGPGEAFVSFTVRDLSVWLAHHPGGGKHTDEDSRIVVEGVRSTPEAVVQTLVRREEYLARKELDEAAGASGLDREQIAWMVDPPGELVAHLTSVRAEMRAAATRLVQSLRWVLRKTATVQPLTHDEFLWSRDGSVWYAAPPRLDDPSGFVGDLDSYELAPGDTVDVVQRLLDDPDFSEPIARQVLLEAGALLQGNPRAAYVLAITAAEIGLKQFVALVSRPSEAWLINEIQSPPLPKLMTDYFQHLLASSDVDIEPFSIPKRLRKRFQDDIERRNHIVHRGVDPPEREEIEELLNAVDEFLYTLDYAAGHRWAAKYLPLELRRTPTDD